MWIHFNGKKGDALHFDDRWLLIKILTASVYVPCQKQNKKSEQKLGWTNKNTVVHANFELTHCYIFHSSNREHVNFIYFLNKCKMSYTLIRSGIELFCIKICNTEPIPKYFRLSSMGVIYYIKIIQVHPEASNAAWKQALAISISVNEIS